jgi:hypothetical protein
LLKRELLFRARRRIHTPQSRDVRLYFRPAVNDIGGKIKVFRDLQFPGRFRSGLGAYNHKIDG